MAINLLILLIMPALVFNSLVTILVTKINNFFTAGIIFGVALLCYLQAYLHLLKKILVTRLNALGKYFVGEIESHPFLPAFKGHFEGKKFCIRWGHPYVRRMMPQARIECYVDLGVVFEINREGLQTKILKMVGLLKDINVGYPEFDRKYFIDSTQDSRIINHFQDAKKRKAVDNLFSKGFYSVRSWGDFVVVEKNLWWNPCQNCNSVFIMQTLKDILVLVE